MEFNLKEIGSRRYVTTRQARKDWNENESVIEVTDKYFIFSKELCNSLNVKDGSVLSFFFKDTGLYLANVSDYDIPKSEQLNLTITKKQGELRGARTARNKQLLNTFTKKANYTVGVYHLDTNYTPGDSIKFPVVRLTQTLRPLDTDSPQVTDNVDMSTEPETSNF